MGSAAAMGAMRAEARRRVPRAQRRAGSGFASVAKRGLHDCHFGLHGKDERTFWGKGEYQLDHFFVEESGKASVRKCEVVTTANTKRLSDHSPLVLSARSCEGTIGPIQVCGRLNRPQRTYASLPQRITVRPRASRATRSHAREACARGRLWCQKDVSAGVCSKS